jgi:opacity protein-like surface antigen
MRKTFFFVVLVLAVSLNCAASDVPKAEIFGGYSFLHTNTGITGISDLASLNSNGWDAAITGNFNQFLGVTAEANGEYKSENVAGASGKIHLHSFLFGPTLSLRAPKVKPFAHVLFGVSRASASADVSGIGSVGSVTDNAFAMAMGGGLDVSVAPLISVRLGQLDFVRTQFGSDSQNHLRYAAGIVLKF